VTYAVVTPKWYMLLLTSYVAIVQDVLSTQFHVVVPFDYHLITCPTCSVQQLQHTILVVIVTTI
jgi:hypothetical protein